MDKTISLWFSAPVVVGVGGVENYTEMTGEI